MKTQITRKRAPMAAQKLRELAELAARVQLIRAANRLQPHNRSLTFPGPWGEPVEVGFIDRQPYGFVFTEGQEASFRVPSGHRFVIEQVNVSSWEDRGALSMHLITSSLRTYRCTEVACSREQCAKDAASGDKATLVVVDGSSANSFVFTDNRVHNSPTVPPDAYLQIWGYLEPRSFPNELGGASPHSGAEPNLHPAAR